MSHNSHVVLSSYSYHTCDINVLAQEIEACPIQFLHENTKNGYGKRSVYLAGHQCKVLWINCWMLIICGAIVPAVTRVGAQASFATVSGQGWRTGQLCHS